jgi:SAM-dependent methyltransferase
MGDSDSGYQFGTGIGEDEVARLEAQGTAVAPATRMIFAEAGIRPGMRVLDLGCGAGDVAFVAADLVGPGGSVVGVDRSPEALARARLRARARGLAQVQFVEGDIHDPAPGGPFDAIVERFVLWSSCGRFRTRLRCCGSKPRCCARRASRSDRSRSLTDPVAA